MFNNPNSTPDIRTGADAFLPEHIENQEHYPVPGTVVCVCGKTMEEHSNPARKSLDKNPAGS